MRGSNRLEEIFSESLKLRDAEERRNYVQQACGEDLELAQQVFALLAAAEEVGSFLESPMRKSKHLPETTPPTAQRRPTSLNAEFPFLAAPIVADEMGWLGPYRILNCVGRGGMGIVFRAFDLKLQRIVAVKVLVPEIAVDPIARMRFEREARSAAAISHPHVVGIHAVDETHNPPYLVMEFVQGKNLAEKLASQGMLSVKEILRIGSQLADGLAAAHQQGLVHRDLKPANVLLENGVERAKLTDFGLAKTVDDMALTRTGDLSGTPQYMSPEQTSGGPVDHRTDLFSLGAILYTMCTGRPPFRADNPFATIKRICEDTPRPIGQVNPEVPDWLSAIIDRLLAKSPSDRFQTAAEVSALLQKHLAMLQAGPNAFQPKRRTNSPTSLSLSSLLSPAFPWFAGVAVTVTALLLAGSWLSNREHRSIESDVSQNAAVSGLPVIHKLKELPSAFINRLGMEFVLVPKGKSWLGGGAGRSDEKEVEIKEDFYLGKYEVTQGEWEAVTGVNPSIFRREGHGQKQVVEISNEELKRFPVEMVSWDDAQSFVEELNKRGQEVGWRYRLPTEAEWEYACRGGPRSNKFDCAHDFYFEKPTNELLPTQANFDFGEKSLKRTCRVGSYAPNQLGLYDMHGNVWESCDDELKDASETADRVLRGGCWADPSVGCATAYRGLKPSNRNIYLGLRVARVPSGPISPQ